MSDTIHPSYPSEPNTPSRLPVQLSGDSSSQSGPGWTSTGSSGSWRQDLARWLVTLNPGRTPREYEKAISYFFETPGVPRQVDDLTFDLLLAYRGALAMRATPHDQRARMPVHPDREPRLPPSPSPNAGAIEGDAAARYDDGESTTPDALPPLAPATVNVRLTALRQFLVYCSLAGKLPHLSPDRIRAALRRLTIERRRPYQILAEQEWDQFLQAASLPHQTQTQAQSALEPSLARDGGEGGDSEDSAAARNGEESASTEPTPTRPSLPKSRSGLTGERTAARDHALIALALATGLRAIELSGLDVGDLAREWNNGVEEWWLILPDAKTKGQRGGRTLPLAPALVETLMVYVKSTGRRWDDAGDRATPLFLSQTRRRVLRASGPYLRLSAAHIRDIVDRVETQWLALRSEGDQQGRGSMLAGETRQISPHALRHSTAIALLEGSASTGRPPASVEHVRGWLGHFDIRTTQGYLAHLDARKHRRPFTLAPGSGAGTGTSSVTHTVSTQPSPGASTDQSQPPSPEGGDNRADSEG